MKKQKKNLFLVQEEKVHNSWLFGQSVIDMAKVAKEIRQRLKVREKILDGPT